MADPVKPPQVVSPEDVEREVEALLGLVGKQAERISKARDAAALGSRKSGPVRAESPRKPDVDDLLRADLRSALSDEIVVATATHGDEEIEPSEFEREIMKRALMMLKLSDLRDEAENRGLDWRGTEENVATRIAQALRFDEREIAELVLSHSDDEERLRGHGERIFALTHTPQIEALTATIQRIVRRYVRVGVARWFVFRSASTPSPNRLVVEGLFRSYRAEPTEVEEDYAIRAIETSARATAVLESGTDLVRVRSKGTAEAIAALAAIQGVTGIQRSSVVPISFELPLELMGWDRRTLYLLDLLAHGLNDNPIFVQNLTAVHFEMDTEQAGDEIRPRIRSVRMEGDWVGDSPQACQFLEAKRTLIGATLRARYRPNSDEIYFFPVRIRLAKDHVDITTGFGRERPENARIAHRVIVDRAMRGLTKLTDPEKTVELTKQLIDRANARGPVRVNLLSQPAAEPPVRPDDGESSSGGDR